MPYQSPYNQLIAWEKEPEPIDSNTLKVEIMHELAHYFASKYVLEKNAFILFDRKHYEIKCVAELDPLECHPNDLIVFLLAGLVLQIEYDISPERYEGVDMLRHYNCYDDLNRAIIIHSSRIDPISYDLRYGEFPIQLDWIKSQDFYGKTISFIESINSKNDLSSLTDRLISATVHSSRFIHVFHRSEDINFVDSYDFVLEPELIQFD